ncbi:MAG: dihydroneopterin aldolase [Akkermansiaceae bacterium]
MKKSDQIFIRGQKVSCFIGVPDAERASAQELLIHTTMSPFDDAQPLEDDIERTIDYHAVYLQIAALVELRPRKLIETLAEELAAMVLTNFPVSSVSIEIEKFILPSTRCVGVSITRTAE